MTFSELSTAARARDLIERIVIKVNERDRPTDRFGTVVSWSAESRIVQVQFPDAPAPISIRAGSILPTEIGQVARVGGINGQWFIEDIQGPSENVGLRVGDLGEVDIINCGSGVNSITVAWDIITVPRYPEYKVEYSTVPGFDLGTVANVITNNIETLVVTDLIARQDYYFRISAGNGNGEFSNPSAVVGPKRTLEVIGADGAPPAFSPQPVVTGGINHVVAKWAPIAQADPVSYIVHASTVSGFTPDSTTFLGETTSSFWFVDQLPDSLPLPTDGSATFVRVIAKDSDGEAAVGAQGIGFARLISAGDVGNVPFDAISDGQAPAASPVAVATPTIGAIYLEWTHPANPDQLTYDIHVSTDDNFVPDEQSTKVGESTQDFAWIANQSLADGGGPLRLNELYYIRLVARDNDGQAPPGIRTPSTIRQVATADVAPGVITRELIANAAINDAKIANLSVTNAKIANGAIDTVKIADAAITQAQITDLAVGAAQIQDLAVNNAKINDLSVAKLTSGIISAPDIILDGVNSSIRSSNFITGADGTGWRISGNGAAELNDAIVRGEVHIGGFTETSFHVDSDGFLYMGGPNFDSAKFAVTPSGDVRVDGEMSVGGDVVLTGGLLRTANSTRHVRIDGTTATQDGAQEWSQIQFFGDNGGVARIFGGDDQIIIRPTDGVGTLGSWATDNIVNFVGLQGTQTIRSQFTLDSRDLSRSQISSRADHVDAFCHDFTVETPDGRGMHLTAANLAELHYDVFDIGVPGAAGDALVRNGRLGGLQFRTGSNQTGMAINSLGQFSCLTQASVATTNILRSSAAGGLFGGVQVTTSSRRFKHNIRSIGEEAMDLVRQMNPVTFSSVIDEGLGTRAGFIAEEIAEVDPILASFEDDDVTPLGLDVTAILSTLVRAVQDLDQRVGSGL